MRTLLPPSTIGIIGGGQLGMMTVREAQRMGYRTAIWDPDPDCPAGRLADELITAPFADPDGAKKLAVASDVVTYEFENIDPATVEVVEALKPVFPGSRILKIARHRKNEKESLQQAGFPVVSHAFAKNQRELEESIKRLGFPVVVKTVTAGYDGKGQSVLRNQADAIAFCRSYGDRIPECVVESFLNLDREVSVVAVRSDDGTITAFPVIENEHRENILHVSRVPARISEVLRAEALRLGTAIIEHFDMVGVLCVEMFVTRDGKLLVNELAPRPHNSGHFSLDACSLSQFEALARCVCRIAVPLPRLLTPCAMVNLLGKHLERIDIEAVSRIPGVKVHLYGKKRREPKRKMGHVTVLRPSAEEVEPIVRAIEAMIGEDEGRSEAKTFRQSMPVV
ncbi:MAG: N5-carboxyaminoimidazole ribonucleotide synthase [Bacteroidia bacterium]|nr:MAG: N5-carboxyaminoimidazole ribonucleotide synthase [Bacteroidia bacterium]